MSYQPPPTSAFDQVRLAKARYCRFRDTRQWNDFTELFVDSPDIRIDDAAGKPMEDYILFPAPTAGQPSRHHGYGHYHEQWTLTPGGWRIASLALRRTILEVTP